MKALDSMPSTKKGLFTNSLSIYNSQKGIYIPSYLQNSGSRVLTDF